MPTAAPLFVYETLDGQVTGLADQISRLSGELDRMRRRDAALSTALQKIDDEQRLAARLQRDFLPKRMPAVDGVAFHTIYSPAGHVSGDLYDVMRLDEDHVGFYVADAVGHGMPAALLTMFMKNALVTKEITAGGYRLLEPAQTIAKLNTSLCSQNLSHATFATAVYGTLCTRTLRLCFAAAGHPGPLLLRDGRLHELKSEGALLGIFPDETFHNCHVQLQQGDRIFCYTDGVETAFTESPDTTHWQEEILARHDRPTGALLRELTGQVRPVDDTASPRDDLTVVAIDVTGSVAGTNACSNDLP